LDRGILGFVPSRAEGEDAPIGDWRIELEEQLSTYGLGFDGLPLSVQQALESRQSFTLVEGQSPTEVYEGRIPAESLLQKVARHDQSTLAIEQMKVYAVHNGEMLYGGQELTLEEILPYPGFEQPRILAIPEVLSDDSGHDVSMTADGTKPSGRVILRSSKDNMPAAFRRLKPRWKVSYRTAYQMIGSKPVSELLPATPGSQFVYATVELAALEPDYVTHGRVRPNDGPLMEALDGFVAGALRTLARDINDTRRKEKDEAELDEVARENAMLNRFKDQFLPSDGEGPGAEEGEGDGPRHKRKREREVGTEPYAIELNAAADGLTIGVDVSFSLKHLLSPVVRDEYGRTVHGMELEFLTDESSVLEVDPSTGDARAAAGGDCSVWVRLASSGLRSEFVAVRTCSVDHVLLSPRQVEVVQGHRKQVVAEITDTEGNRKSNVILNWKHDADDQLVVRIGPTGWITGNRIGETHVYAGAGDPETGVWSRIPAAVSVGENPDRIGSGEGHPELKLTGRDVDPETGQIRQGDPEEPALWQEVSDVKHNIWWLNLDAPDALLAFSRRAVAPEVWRHFHVVKLAEMVAQAHMQAAYTASPSGEVEDYWGNHKYALERFVVQYSPQMWDQLKDYVLEGGEV